MLLGKRKKLFDIKSTPFKLMDITYLFNTLYALGVN